jgi:hypothetical protein
LLRKKAVEAHEMLLQTMPMAEEAAWREGSSRRRKGTRGTSGESEVVVVRHAGVAVMAYRPDLGRNARRQHKATKYRGSLLLFNREPPGPFDGDRAATGVTSLKDIFEVDREIEIAFIFYTQGR